jgi:hypothetical protein
MMYPISIESSKTHYSIPQLARITNESDAVWRKRILRNDIGYVKCGRNVRVSAEELQRWLTARSVSSKRAGQYAE